MSGALVMSMERSGGLSRYEDIRREGRKGEGSEGGSSAEQTHGAAILVGMAFFCMASAGRDYYSLTYFIGSEYQ